LGITKKDSLIPFCGSRKHESQIHQQVETYSKTGVHRRLVREEVRDIVCSQLQVYEKTAYNEVFFLNKVLDKKLALANSFCNITSAILLF
jgi:hypothetical protein